MRNEDGVHVAGGGVDVRFGEKMDLSIFKHLNWLSGLL